MRFGSIIIASVILFLIIGCSSNEYEIIDEKYYESSPDDVELTVACHECDTLNECSYVCLSSCAEEGKSKIYYKSPSRKDGNCICYCNHPTDNNMIVFNEAILEKDFSRCMSLENEDKYYTRDDCLLYMAMILEDKKACNDIEEVAKKDMCFSQVATALKDTSLCDMIVKDKSYCLSKVENSRPTIAKPK